MFGKDISTYTYIPTYICIYTCVYTYIYIQNIYIYIHMCVYIYICKHIHIGSFTCWVRCVFLSAFISGAVLQNPRMPNAPPP